MDEFTPRKNHFKVQYPDVSVSRVYLGDSNPADTGVQWGSHSQSWGPTTAEIARPCRQKPCRSEAGEVTSRGGGEAPGRHRVFWKLGGAARRLVVGAPGPAPVAPCGQPGEGGAFAANPAPFLRTRGGL